MLIIKPITSHSQAHVLPDIRRICPMTWPLETRYQHQ